MRKLLLAAAAFGLIVALGAPALAAELKAGGTMKAKYIVTNENSGGQFYPTEDINTYRATLYRMNPQFQFLATEKSGMVWAGEIDTVFGNSAYTNGASGGGGLAADTVNIETKNAYIHFDIPETPLSFRVGVAAAVDSYNFAVFATDMAGFRLLADMGDTKINADWLTWWDDNNTGIVDDVDMYVLELRQKLGAYNVGGSFYYLHDGSGNTKGGKGLLNNAPGVRADGESLNYYMYNRATGLSPIIPTGVRYKLDAYYLGAFGSGLLGPVSVDGGFLYNFGTVKDLTNDEDNDINAFLFDARGAMALGPVNASLETIYVSGDDKQVGDGDFGLITGNQYQYAGAFYLRHGMMILLPDPDDLNNSAAFAYDVANIYENTYLGIWAITANANMNLPMNLNAKVGVGYLMSAEDRLVNSENAMGTEVNGTLSYNLAAGTTIYINGAYAWTGKFFEVSAEDAAKYNAKVDSKKYIGGKIAANEDPDDIWYTSIVFRVAM